MQKIYKCLYCGREFQDKIPHKCNNGYRKHHLKFKKMQQFNVINYDFNAQKFESYEMIGLNVIMNFLKKNFGRFHKHLTNLKNLFKKNLNINFGQDVNMKSFLLIGHAKSMKKNGMSINR